jgi:hypothetical protein
MLAGRHLGHELATYLSAALTRGEIREDLDAGRCGVLLAAGYFTIVLQWIEAADGQVDLHSELSQMTELFLHGILAAKTTAVRRSRRRSA